MKKVFDPIDILGKRKQGNLGDILNGYMSKFIIRQSPRLIDMDDEIILIKQGICPICECKLKVSKRGDIFCNSVKHKSITSKKLFITKDGFSKIK